MMPVYVPGGKKKHSNAGSLTPDAIHFLNEAYKHCKAIAADEDSLQVLAETYFYDKLPDEFTEEEAVTNGIIITDDNKMLASNFIRAIAMHRFWDREKLEKVPG